MVLTDKHKNKKEKSMKEKATIRNTAENELVRAYKLLDEISVKGKQECKVILAIANCIDNAYAAIKHDGNIFADEIQEEEENA